MAIQKPLNAEQAAKVLGVSLPTIRAWTGQRRIKFYKLGRRVVYDRQDLEAFAEKQCVEAIEPRSLKAHSSGE